MKITFKKHNDKTGLFGKAIVTFNRKKTPFISIADMDEVFKKIYNITTDDCVIVIKQR